MLSAPGVASRIGGNTCDLAHAALNAAPELGSSIQYLDIYILATRSSNTDEEQAGVAFPAMLLAPRCPNIRHLALYIWHRIPRTQSPFHPLSPLFPQLVELQIFLRGRVSSAWLSALLGCMPCLRALDIFGPMSLRRQEDPSSEGSGLQLAGSLTSAAFDSYIPPSIIADIVGASLSTLRRLRFHFPPSGFDTDDANDMVSRALPAASFITHLFLDLVIGLERNLPSVLRKFVGLAARLQELRVSVAPCQQGRDFLAEMLRVTPARLRVLKVRASWTGMETNEAKGDMLGGLIAHLRASPPSPALSLLRSLTVDTLFVQPADGEADLLRAACSERRIMLQLQGLW